MPKHDYSVTGHGNQSAYAISEPRDARGVSPQRESFANADDEVYGIQAKEPDRPSATRRGAQSGRTRTAVADTEEETTPRRRPGQQRASARRTPAPARRSAGPAARRTGAAETKTARKKSRRGFAAMSAEQQREIARKGGLTVSRNRRHMADIGRVGGEHSHGGRRSRR